MGGTRQEPRLLVPNHNVGRPLSLFDLPELSSTSRPNSSHRSSPKASRSNSPHLTSPSSRISTPRITPPTSPKPVSHQLYLPETDSETPTPLIICFHGSGDTCRNSWRPLAKELHKKHRVLFFERSIHGDVESETNELSAYLSQNKLPGPYVLIAHSHGGAFARCFLNAYADDVVGMIMVETGQEATWNAKLQERQEEHHILGRNPLVVIKARSLLRKWKQLEKDRETIETRMANGEVVGEATKAKIMIMEGELRKWEKEDDKLKRRQLKMSKKNKFVELTEVGHHVIRDKPEAVIEAVEWVMDNLYHGDGTPDSRRSSIEHPQSAVSAGGGSWLRKVSLALGMGDKDDGPGRRSSR